MSGISYTMKEMKTIVDYLVEHKAYGLTKGRKMWMNFENSPQTQRTWQSLKETFLKRILPDICNPYYKLTAEQIHSFKQGTDMEDKTRNKLDIQREINLVSEDSSTNDENSKNCQQPSTSKANTEETGSGENIKSSKILLRDRSSVDTVILERCYETADEVRKALESPIDKQIANEDQDTQASSSLSFKNRITFSEPLTPMLQEVLHDFASDDTSDSEPRMQIVENEPVSDCHETDKSPQRSPLRDVTPETEQNNIKDKSQNAENINLPKIKSLRLKKKETKNKATEDWGVVDSTTDNIEPNSSEKETSTKTVMKETPDSITKRHIENVSKASEGPTQTNSTADTVLPNNQEALSGLPQKHQNSNISSNDISKVSRPRAASQDHCSVLEPNDKSGEVIIGRKQMSVSDTDIKKTKINPAFKKAFKNKVLSHIIKESNNNDLAHSKAMENKKETSNTNDQFDCSAQTSQVNPCLQSVSLFDEHLNLDNSIESSDTESKQKEGSKKKIRSVENKNSINRQNEPNIPQNTTDVNKNLKKREKKNNYNKADDVVLLKSHSESDSDVLLTKSPASKAMPTLKRKKALDKLFGFSSGAVITKRKMCTSRKLSSHQCNKHNSSMESSEWTSETDSEYMSPPRSRRRRHADNTIKPRSLRIQALDEEGGLFVMYRNKIYPLVKKGKKMTRYLLHNPESDSEEDNNFWKEKYEKEKKRVTELKRLVDDYSREKSPLLPAKLVGNPTTPRRLDTPRCLHTPPKEIPRKICDNQAEPEVKQEQTNKPPTDKTLKITFAKNNQEVHLEGHWSQLHPVLADVVEIFHKDVASDRRQMQPQPVDQPMDQPMAYPNQIAHQERNEKRASQEAVQSPRLPLPPVVIELDSEKSSATTPVDPDVRQKTLQLESKIFQEIEEREQKEEENNAKDEDSVGNNVTKRKRKVTETSSAANALEKSPSTSTKRLKTTSPPAEVEEATSIIETLANGATDNTRKSSVTPKKRTRTPKKIPESKGSESKASTSGSKLEIKTKQIKKSLLNISKPSEDDEDNEILYMFPVTRNTASKTRAQTNRRHLNTHHPKIYSPNISQHSESNQGYVDSDVSPVKLLSKRRRRLSLSTASKKNKMYQRAKRHSCPTIIGDISSDSNTSLHIVIKHHNNDYSLKSSLYRSESYQLLVPQKQKSFNALKKITEEYSLAKNESDIRRPKSPISECSEDIIETGRNKIHSDIASHGHSSYGNSSSVSLPPSPELSIVENLSVSKELLSSISNCPTNNEIKNNDPGTHIIDEEFLISNIDVSMPLIHQDYSTKTKRLGQESQYSYSMDESKKSGISQSLVKKIETVNLTGGISLSESLNHRLEHLLLESAKKISDHTQIQDENALANIATKKGKNSKRCSTPHKKNQKKTRQTLKIDPVVEEEYMETCSYKGRKSCPPIIENIMGDHVNMNQLTVPGNEGPGVSKENTKRRASRARVKKDIIKVKISRPKAKRKSGKSSKESEKPCINQSVRADSGINITESVTSSNSNNSVDLIHNHSETCLQANECLNDSVELIETTESIISINSDSSDIDIETRDVFEDCKDIITEILSSNAKDFTNGLHKAEPDALKIESPTETQYHSPIASETSINSLITEDLSDDILQTCPQTPPSPHWFVLSNDSDNTNTDHTPKSNSSSFGANLKQIFPITCAIPDLSTITETSKDNEENSRRPFSDFSTCDTNTEELETI